LLLRLYFNILLLGIMSYSFVLSGNSAILTADFHPPIYLEENFEYVIGLINFETFNAIPNIDETNNLFIYDTNREYRIPPGSYEIDDINNVLQQQLDLDHIYVKLFANNNTLRTHIKTGVPITFRKGTIGNILGFKNKELEANLEHISDYPAEIIKVNSINIDCSIAEGSYLNGDPVHIIHQFFPSVAPGFKIIESPQNIIYFPVTVKIIDKITLKIVDQEGQLINFRGETVTIRLHLKKVVDNGSFTQ
jgi:hypothetical protein